VTWLDELARELQAAGVRGRTRSRILSELEDHLLCEPGSETRLGSPKELAASFAEELGTSGARRAAVVGFLALGLSGVLFAIALLSLQLVAAPDVFAGAVPGAAFVLQPLVVLAPQVAFVAGGLAAWRAFRLRRARILPAAEVRVLNRRTATALTAAAAAFAAVALYALDFHRDLPGWWTALALSACAIALCALALGALPLLRTTRLRPREPGDAGDLYSDLPLLAPLTPWRLAAFTALALGMVVATALAAQGDPLDGLTAGVAEASAVLAGFAVLGRPLGLRR
jgi:hypothetical protein